VVKLVLVLQVLLNVKRKALSILNISVIVLVITKRINAVILVVVVTVVRLVAVLLTVNAVLVIAVLLKLAVVMGLLGLKDHVLLTLLVALKL
jgi:hypothetical protein